MLGALVDYANRKIQGVETGFTPKEIRWLAGVSPDGRFTGIIQLGDQGGQKYSPDIAFPELIGMSKSFRAMGYTIEQASHFLADTCAVVFKLPELDREGNLKKPDEHTKNLQKHETFKLFMELASVDVPNLEPIFKALSDEVQMIEFYQVLLEQSKKGGKEKLKTTDKISFFVDGKCVLDTQEWRVWWRSFRTRVFGKPTIDIADISSSKMLSLVTGEVVEPVSTHPKIMNLGGSAFGFSFVSYGKDAFESYGLVQGENGAVDQASATTYRAAIDSMLENAKQLGEMKVALWFDRDMTLEEDLFSSLFEPNPEGAEQDALEKAKSLLEAIRIGKKPRSLSNSRFNSIAMSGADGRVMVRDWQTGSLEDFAKAVRCWFEDLSIVNAQGNKNAKLPGLNSLLMSIRRAYDPKKDKSVDVYLTPLKNLQIPLWRAALNPVLPIPFSAICKIMESQRSCVITGDFYRVLSDSPAQKDQKVALKKWNIYARMGLLKAYHNRKGDYPMTPALDPNHPSKAYHCGRLMCLLAHIQEKALGDDINAGVVQRYYGAASSTPALVLGRLTRLSQHHLSKISRDSGGLGYWLNMQVAEVWNALGKDLPPTLTLEEQSLFALGYYQQFAFNRTKRSGNPESPADDTDQPSL